MTALRATVLLPTTGDRGPLLTHATGSVLAQTVREIELFIMGDGVDEATRQVAAGLAAQNPRVRFFDHPKDARRGELNRHAALEEARGEIVCYLTDRDLMLPNHVEVMCGLLEEADFAHTLRFGIRPNGSLSFDHTVDITDPEDRAQLWRSPRLVPLAFAGHTLAMYRRLPHGWRTTPLGQYTDRYMWEQFLAQPDCRTASSTRPTILYFNRGKHPGWPVARRLEEIERWHGRMQDPAWLAAFTEEVRDAAIRDRARIARDAERRAKERRARAAALREREKAELARRGRRRGFKGVMKGARKRWRGFVEAVERRLRYWRQEPPRSHAAHITDIERLVVQPGLRLEIYWVGGRFGPGPGASVYAGDDEVMRLDCFGGALGHMHLNLKAARLLPGGGGARLEFRPGDIADHVARAAFELEHNLAYALQLSSRRKTRAIRLDRDAVADATDWLHAGLTRIAARHAGGSAGGGGQPR